PAHPPAVHSFPTRRSSDLAASNPPQRRDRDHIYGYASPMFPGAFAATTPDKPAMIRPATGEQITYAQLESRSAQLAHLLADHWRLRRGDTIAVISDNTLELVEIYWAALRSGLYRSALNPHLTPQEATYTVNGCGARALFVSAAVADHVDLSAGA